MVENAGSRGRSTRMTGKERREQLVTVGRRLFAEKGFDMTTVEEIAARAKVSKPIVYEHFGGKEGLYAVVVDREVSTLLGELENSLQDQRAHPRVLMEQAALSFLSYIDENEDGFRILVRDSPVSHGVGTFSSLLTDVARRVEEILAAQLSACSTWPVPGDPRRPALDALLSRARRGAVCADAGGDGRLHRPVVARDAQALEGDRRRAHDQPLLVRAQRPAEEAHPAPGHPALTGT